MKVIQFLLFVFSFCEVFAITVPPSWYPSNGNKQLQSRRPQMSYKLPSVATTLLPINSDKFEFISFFPSDAKPAKSVQNLQYRPPNNRHLIINHPTNRQVKNYNPQSYQIVKFDNQNQDIPITQKTRVNKLRNSPKNAPNIRYKPEQNIANKNTPIRQFLTEVNPPDLSGQAPQQTKINEEYSEPISEHEIPREVPTRPIYPGEGQWAKYGQKHRPYIHPGYPEKVLEESEERPDGYDTFEKEEQQFTRAKNNFRHDINTFPERHNLKPSKIQENSPTQRPLYEPVETTEFVPEKIYHQVRRTETEEHLPRSSIDPEEEENAARLREIVKDKRIHTVYTEEGYEDSAYDHAGHEKNAENHEGHGRTHNDHSKSSERAKAGQRGEYFDEKGNRRGQNHERRKIQNSDTSKNEDYSNSKRYKTSRGNIKHDSATANSENESKKANSTENLQNKNNSTERSRNIVNRKRSRKVNNDSDTANSDFETRKINTNEASKENTTSPSKDVKKVTLHNGQANIDMEIITEIKYTPQKKKHKFIKIIPSPQNTTNSTENNEETTSTPRRRVKRYNKEELSKRYVRKRPQYYWKKKATTPFPKIRLKYEDKTNSKTKADRFDPEDITQKSRILKPSTIKTTTSKTTTTTIESATTTARTETAEITSTEKLIVGTTSNDSVSISSTTIHPDLMNPELTTKLSRPATPKTLPVKIKKFKAKRQKRYTNDFPNIDVDLSEFEDVRDFPNPTKLPNLAHLKYPYYNLPKESLSPNSPLRYAEDLKNIPQKLENELSFYKSRDVIECPEIERNVNPIPERIENQENGEQTEEMPDKPDLPRLKGLGNKIDCLKQKYFGENPLDSPFFQEEIVEDPVPFFEIKKVNTEASTNISEQASTKVVISTPNDKNSEKRELKIRLLQPIIVEEDDLVESATVNPIHKNTEAVLKPPYTLTEMMNINQRNIVKPKSIYDQINILEKDEPKVINRKNDVPPTDFIIVYDNHNNAETSSSVPKQDLSTVTSQIRKRPTSGIIRKLPAKTIKKPQRKYVTMTTDASTTTTESSTIVPNQKPSENRPWSQVQANNNWRSANRGIAAFYNIFDISRYLPRVPNHRQRTNEYSSSDRPSEQMKVYSDVLQSINNENKEASSKPLAVAISVPAENAQNQRPVTTTAVYTELPKQERTSTQPSTEKPVDLTTPIQDTPLRIILPEPKSTEKVPTTSSSQKFNILTFFNNLRRLKRDVTSNKKNNDDLLAEASEIRPVYSSVSRNKPQYTEIVRQRPARVQTAEEEEDDEDLNPRKRVYEISTNRRRTTTTAPVYEEEIIEEIEAETTTTAKPVIYPVEANKDDPKIAQYIFFIEKLHDKWAKEDATSTTQAPDDSKAVMTQVVSESVDERSGEPTYLQIINQLHMIREEEASKTSTTSTTEAYEVIPMKNSNPFFAERDSFISEVNSMKANLDSDTADSSNSESSRNRDFNARFLTNIDTSKYKTIERAPVNFRHNLSSRFNSDDQNLPLQKEKTTQTPMIIIITRPQVTTESLKDISSEPNLTTTTQSSRLRGRTRGRTSYTTTTRSTNSGTINPIFRRRRPTRITTTTSTTSRPEVSRRRNISRLTTAETQSVTTPATTESLIIVTPSTEEPDEPKKQRRFQKVKERHVTSEVTFTKFFEPVSDEESSEESQKQQYEIIAPLTHTDTRHGGNYKRENDRNDPSSSEEFTAKVQTPNEYYNDPNLALNINQLKETKEVSTERYQSSNILLNREEIKEKVTEKAIPKIDLYPNMARMVNRLAELNTEDASSTGEDNSEDESTEKPIFIKDPSKRNYYYAKL